MFNRKVARQKQINNLALPVIPVNICQAKPRRVTDADVRNVTRTSYLSYKIIYRAIGNVRPPRSVPQRPVEANEHSWLGDWEADTIYENTNGLLREYFPKGYDFSKLSDEDLQAVVDQLNHRPWKCLGYRTLQEVYFSSMLHLAWQSKLSKKIPSSVGMFNSSGFV